MNLEDENGKGLFLELSELIEASLRGDLTEDERNRLEALVREDPAARRIYIHYLHDSQSLHTSAEQPAVESAPVRRARPPFRSEPGRSAVAYGLAAGFAALLLAGIAFLVARASGRTRVPPPERISKAAPRPPSPGGAPPSQDARKVAEDRLAEVERQLRDAEREKRQAEEAKEQERLRKAEAELQAVADAYRKAQEDLAKTKTEERRPPEKKAPASEDLPKQKKELPGTRPVLALAERSEGQVWRTRDTERKALKVGDPLLKGDGLETAGGASLAVLKYPDNTRVELGPETVIREMEVEGGKRIGLLKGSLRAEVEKQPQGQPMTVVTPLAKAVVQGTQFMAWCGADSTFVHVSEGRVQLTRQKDGKSVLVAKGEHAEVAATVDLAVRKGTFARVAYRCEFDAPPSGGGVGEPARLSEPGGEVTAVASARFPPEDRRKDIGWEPDVQVSLFSRGAAAGGLLFDVPKDFELRLRLKAEKKGEIDVSLRHVTLPARTPSTEVSQTRQRVAVGDRWTEVILRAEDFKAFLEAPGFPAAPGVAGPQAAIGEFNVYGYGTGRLYLDRVLVVSNPPAPKK